MTAARPRSGLRKLTNRRISACGWMKSRISTRGPSPMTWRTCASSASSIPSAVARSSSPRLDTTLLPTDRDPDRIAVLQVQRLAEPGVADQLDLLGPVAGLVGLERDPSVALLDQDRDDEVPGLTG